MLRNHQRQPEVTALLRLCMGLKACTEPCNWAQSLWSGQHASIGAPVDGIKALHGGLYRQLPEKECRANDCTVLAVTKRGGHCGHLQGLDPFGASYLDDTIISFFKAVLGFRYTKKEE